MEEQHKSKIVWVLFIIIAALIGVIIYMYYSDTLKEETANIAPTAITKTTPTASATTVASATPTTTVIASPTSSATPSVNNFVYTNDKYGFSVTLDEGWEGYIVKEETPNIDATAYLRFYVPSTLSNDHDMTGYYNPITITAFTKAQWNNLEKVGPYPQKIGENTNYVIGFNTAQYVPNDLRNIFTSTEFNKVRDSIIVK